MVPCMSVTAPILSNNIPLCRKCAIKHGHIFKTKARLTFCRWTPMSHWIKKHQSQHYFRVFIKQLDGFFISLQPWHYWGYANKTLCILTSHKKKQVSIIQQLTRTYIWFVLPKPRSFSSLFSSYTPCMMTLNILNSLCTDRPGLAPDQRKEHDKQYKG